MAAPVESPEVTRAKMVRAKKAKWHRSMRSYLSLSFALFYV